MPRTDGVLAYTEVEQQAVVATDMMARSGETAATSGRPNNPQAVQADMESNVRRNLTSISRVSTEGKLSHRGLELHGGKSRW